MEKEENKVNEEEITIENQEGESSNIKISK